MTRIRELDALRGFAVCGIMLVNTWQQVDTVPGSVLDTTIETLFAGRFYPLFSVLFGMSFVLVLRSGSRWLTLSRLGWLMVFGLVQHAYYEGEVLTDYAFYGLVALLPASFLSPGWPIMVLGGVVTIWGAGQGGGAMLIPGLLLVGMALMQLRPPRSLLPPAFAVSAAAALVLLSLGDPFRTAGQLAGASAYATGLLLILRPRLSRVLEPLGRMALTNYVTGTLVLFLTAPARAWVIPLAAVTVLAQALLSRWWLDRFRFGPLEWVWRCLTRFRPVPNRLQSRGDDHRPVPDPGLP
ncbi:DUF418 domain-containing protein [Nonomuraea longicatena]|uniref:DUF418 domain-containing protein n=1 Tax=Nonomuraea longicatena TaxID=83682 RepID=A0ABN1NPA0_9ACTN